jgi:hypothetical protein
MSDVEGLERRIAALAARRDALRAQTRKRERAEDLRRKIVLGALVMSRWTDGQMPDEWRRALDRYLSRPRDRLLFSLGGAPI